MAVQYPWPESQQRVEARIRSLVESVLRPGECQAIRLEWVTPLAHRWDEPDAGWVALRLTVSAGPPRRRRSPTTQGEIFEREVWGPDWHCPWEDELSQTASDLEDWVCETSFGWGEQRIATVPD